MKSKKRSITYYDILNVRTDAGDDDIRQAYHALARKWHPDMNPKNRRKAAENFNLVHMAYAHLRTKPQRAAYNRVLARRTQAGIKPTNDNRKPHGVIRLLTNVREILWPIAPKQEAQRHG